jgi:hypothetical protein
MPDEPWQPMPPQFSRPKGLAAPVHHDPEVGPVYAALVGATTLPAGVPYAVAVSASGHLAVLLNVEDLPDDWRRVLGKSAC